MNGEKQHLSWLSKSPDFMRGAFSKITPFGKRRCSRAPVILFFLLAAAIFTANFFITYIHDYMPNLTLWQHALADSVVLSIILLPCIYIFWFGPLWREVQERKKAEESITRLSRKLITAAEEERKKLALDLHDECSQHLTELQFGIESLLLLPPHQIEEKQIKLAGIQELLQQFGDQIRNFSSGLRPDMLDDLGIVPTLQWYVSEVALNAPDVRIDFEAIGLQKRLPSSVELVLYRVCQESLTNVMKHAHADQVKILLTYSHPKVILSVKDNGIGFNPAPHDHQGEDGKHGLGLLGMRERVSSIGGQWSVNSSRNRGTVIRVELPVPHEGETV